MDIQKLHDWAKVEKEKAYSKVKNPEYAINGMRSEAIKEFDAFSLILNGAELLLLHEPEASAETALSANTMLGEVPAPLVKDQAIKEVAGGLGETPAVRQNEQTKELCPRCNEDTLISLSTGVYCMRQSCNYHRTQ